MTEIPARELSTMAMVGGNEKTHKAVIDRGILKEWVGIGWIELREATDKDREKFPEVKYD